MGSEQCPGLAEWPWCEEEPSSGGCGGRRGAQLSGLQEAMVLRDGRAPVHVVFDLPSAWKTETAGARCISLGQGRPETPECWEPPG